MILYNGFQLRHNVNNNISVFIIQTAVKDNKQLCVYDLFTFVYM